MPNIMLTDIMQQFHIDAAVFGQFSGAYYLGYCLMHLPLGILLDRYGPKVIMTLCILLTVGGLLPIIFAKHWIYPIMGRFLIGAGSSGAILGAFKIIRMVFHEQRFTRMLSYTVTLGLLGAIYGGTPLSYLCRTYGYQGVVQLLAILGLVLAGIAYLLIPEAPNTHCTTVLSDLKAILTNSKVLLVCCLAGFMVGPLEGFADAWGSEFLKQVYGFDAAQANYILSMIYIGMCFAPVLSRIAEKTGCYLETIAGAGLTMLLVFAALVLRQFNMQSMIASLFLVGICCAYQILAIYKASTYVPESISGLTTAIANMIIMSFGYIFHSTIGLILQAYSSHGERIAFVYGVGCVPLLLGVGVLGFCILSYKERKSISLPSRTVSK